MDDPTATQQVTNTRGISPYLVWLIWIIWLPLFTPAILELFQSHPTVPHLTASLGGAALFFGIYLWATWRNVQRLVSASPQTKHSQVSLWLTIAVLSVLCFALIPGNGSDWGDLFIFTSAYIGGRLATVRAVQAIVALALLILIFGRLGGANWPYLVQGSIFTAIVGIVTVSIVRAITASRELRAAREEIARLAVTAERLRIARDLHDLLGHNLSLIALKSELAGRLIAVSPGRASVEVKDIETTARATLQEVREAVASYRHPTLASELHAAAEILAAAGIDYRYEGEENMAGNLPSPVEAVLAWTTREGVTNVIKHSRARHCVIRVALDNRIVSVDITDDGTAPGSTANTGGNGLRGLTERVEKLHGQFEAGPRSDGGFRLTVSLPLAPMQPDIDRSRTPTRIEEQHMTAHPLEHADEYVERSEQR